MCPTALHGVHTGKEGKQVLRMEVLADDYLRIWSISSGYPGSLNDLSIMARSPLMQRIRNGEWPLAIPEVNIGSMTLKGFYFIVDSIYPRHRIFINSYSKPRSQKEKAFSRQQEGVRKTVERVFAVLSGRFQILARPFRLWGKKDIGNIVHSCAALHNAMMEFRKISGDNNGPNVWKLFRKRFVRRPFASFMFRVQKARRKPGHTSRLTSQKITNITFNSRMRLWNMCGNTAKKGIKIAIVTTSNNYK
jgi:hypothetical protein